MLHTIYASKKYQPHGAVSSPGYLTHVYIHPSLHCLPSPVRRRLVYLTDQQVNVKRRPFGEENRVSYGVFNTGTVQSASALVAGRIPKLMPQAL